MLAALPLLAAPWPLKALAALAVLGHGWLRRPARPPRSIAVAADGYCNVPELGSEWLKLSPSTRLTTFWVRLVLRADSHPLDILLLADQLDAATWRRLSARLRRVAVPPHEAS